MHIAEEKCCPIGYKRIEALKLDPLVLIMPSLASRPLVRHLATSIWQFYTCGVAFTQSVTAIATAHTAHNPLHPRNLPPRSPKYILPPHSTHTSTFHPSANIFLGRGPTFES